MTEENYKIDELTDKELEEKKEELESKINLPLKSPDTRRTPYKYIFVRDIRKLEEVERELKRRKELQANIH